MIRHYNSGIYLESFYTKHEINFTSDHSLMVNVEFNRELLAQHYQDHDGFTYDENNEWDKWDQVDEEFWYALSMWCIYYEPQIFNEKIALECGLTPFTYNGKNMLALSSCGMDLSPRLDAYQALTDGTIDKCSKLLSDSGHEYFEHVVGRDVTQRVLRAVM